MASNPSALLALAESVADGASVDWNSAEADAGDERAVIRQLRILADLAMLHRSLPIEPADLPTISASSRSRDVASTHASGKVVDRERTAIGHWAHLSLLERIGRGAYGEVYCAWDRYLERKVALKLLRFADGLTDPLASTITKEGRLLARVRHPNVITVHGVAVHDHRVGLWMELIQGTTLEQILSAHGPSSAREAALVGIDLCRALAALHGAGLIHRDIKAQNVMREDGGRIVLMDLGTGREMAPTDGAQLSDLAGTPLYIAPEIFEGASASVRSDIYSLGVLLYHVVTANYPVRATTITELRHAHRSHRSVVLRDARADLPTAFVRVVDRATSRNPEQRHASAGALEADLAQALDEAASHRVTTPQHPPRVKRLAGRGAAAIAVGIALAAVATLALGAIGYSWPWLRAAPPAPVRSIAVLPLANLSGDPEQEYFADGMTEELIATLGRLKGINVISRTSVMQFKGTSTPIPKIAEQLRVDAILEGSISIPRPAAIQGETGGRRVRVNARLIHAGSDSQLWSRTFETVVGDVFTLQVDLAKAVTESLGMQLRPENARASARQNFDALDLYLRGRYQWNMRTHEGLTRSIQYFREAITRDPTYAPAHAGLADAYNLLGVYGFLPRDEAIALARRAAAMALNLDDTLGEVHASLGHIHANQLEWSEAEASLTRAVALNPGYASAHHWYADYLAQRERFQESLAAIRTAVALDPLSVSVNGELGAILVFTRQYDAAVIELERTIRLDPLFPRTHMVLAQAFAGQGLYSRAVASAQRAVELAGGAAEFQAHLACQFALAGRPAQATVILESLIQRYQSGKEQEPVAIAIVYANLGDNDRAFEWLERARERHDAWLGYLRVDPRFDPLRQDGRFEALLRAVGLAP